MSRRRTMIKKRHKKLFKFVALMTVSWIFVMGAFITTSQTKEVTIRYQVRAIKFQVEFYSHMIELFEKEQPNIKVKLETIPAEEYQAKLLTMFAGGTIGDSFWNSTDENARPLMARGLMKPLDPLVKKDNYDLSKFFGWAIDAITYKGNLYWLPDRAHPGIAGLFYNKEIFDEYGVEYPNYSWNYDALAEKAKKVTRGEKQWGIIAPTDMFTGITVIRSLGGDVLNEAGTKALMDKPESIEAIKYLRDLIYKHKVAIPPGAAALEYAAPQIFSMGKVAMFFGGCWHIGTCEYYMKGKEEWSVGPVPRDKGGRITASNVGVNGIAELSKHPEEVWEWLKFLSTKKVAKKCVEAGIVPAARPDIWFDPDFMIMKDSRWRVYAMALDRNPSLYTMPANFRARELEGGIFNPTLDRVWKEDENVEKICKLLQSKIEQLLKKPMPK